MSYDGGRVASEAAEEAKGALASTGTGSGQSGGTYGGSCPSSCGREECEGPEPVEDDALVPPYSAASAGNLPGSTWTPELVCSVVLRRASGLASEAGRSRRTSGTRIAHGGRSGESWNETIKSCLRGIKRLRSEGLTASRGSSFSAPDFEVAALDPRCERANVLPGSVSLEGEVALKDEKDLLGPHAAFAWRTDEAHVLFDLVLDIRRFSRPFLMAGRDLTGLGRDQRRLVELSVVRPALDPGLALDGDCRERSFLRSLVRSVLPKVLEKVLDAWVGVHPERNGERVAKGRVEWQSC